MASWYVFNTRETNIDWSFTLSNPFTSSYYQKAVLSTGSTTNGSTEAPYGQRGTVYPSSGYGTTVDFYYFGSFLSDTTYYLRCYVLTLSGQWYEVGSQQSFTTQAPELPRPDNWYWWSTVASGYDFNISANEWNSFLRRIEDFYEWKYGSTTYLGSVWSGKTFEASDYNTASSTIGNLRGFSLGTKYSGDKIYASDLNYLVTMLNGVTK